MKVSPCFLSRLTTGLLDGSGLTSRKIYSLASRGFGPDTEPQYQAQRPPPFPYKTHNYNAFWACIDGTLQRWDDNTKIVVIEGIHASGKSTFARELARVTGLKLFSEVVMDMLYINPYGFDKRRIQVTLPGGGHDFSDVKCYDWPDIYREPNDRGANCKLLNRLMFLRAVQYRDALDHIYNTGQGCIIDQSFFGDFILHEAFKSMGYISREALNVLISNRFVTVGGDHHLNYPHLAIYLDVAPEVCLERIKARNLPYEANSPIFRNADYLRAQESAYKEKFFTDMERFSEIVVYDWTHFGDMQWVCDDLEKLDLEFHRENLYRLRDWYYHNDNMLCRKRRELPNRIKTYNIYSSYYPQCDDFNTDPNQALAYDRALSQCPGEQYAYGYNSDMRDPHVLFKTKDPQFRYVNDNLPIHLARKAVMDKILDDPANRNEIEKRTIRHVEEEIYKNPIDHY